ncbi:hypothetical protein QBC47DRAFT_296789 [Echria macrotheca]|uniref:Uncharacterized protein n=1 Tax=Echria macrotheca TaxID=438768 RepID=A0AAJ0BFR3_9PEZI|nr:hypothetical protein QBC47DRAFT_296789 [Echria macrotheca]
MAGGFSPIDEQRCIHYAAFASHLDRKSFDAIYWILFFVNILILFIASWQYSHDHEAAKDVPPGTREYKHRMMNCMYRCLAYFSASVVCIVMEVYALLALQFCDGEDLMSLFWATWTMLQLGSLVAIGGIILAVYNNIRGNKNPPWALALGTPVLVVAGIGHAFNMSMRKRVERVRVRGRSRSRRRTVSVSSSTVNRLEGIMTSDVPISREETLRMDDSEKEDADYKVAKLVGFTPDGGVIIQFGEDPGAAITPDRGTVLGRGEGGQVLVAFRKSMTIITDGNGYPMVSEKRVASSSTLNIPSPTSPLTRPPPVVRIATPPMPSRGDDIV